MNHVRDAYLAFYCFLDQFIDTYNQQNGAESGLSWVFRKRPFYEHKFTGQKSGVNNS